jgi:hypothetical protein
MRNSYYHSRGKGDRTPQGSVNSGSIERDHSGGAMKWLTYAAGYCAAMGWDAPAEWEAQGTDADWLDGFDAANLSQNRPRASKNRGAS